MLDRQGIIDIVTVVILFVVEQDKLNAGASMNSILGGIKPSEAVW